jgi:chromosome segregation ATPase
MTPDERFSRIEKTIDELTEIQSQQANAIRDLTTLSGTILGSQKRFTTQLNKLQEAQKHTEGKLNALIDTVDRIIRKIGR